MNSYIAEHKQKRIERYLPTSISNLVPGNIVQFDYMLSENNKHPHVLVLNPRYNSLLHGLVIDYMTLRQLDNLKSYIISEAEEVNPGTPDLLIDSLGVLSKLSQTPLTFYESRLKPYLRKYFSNNNIYRTYRLQNISNLKLVIYNFSKTI